MLFSLQKILLLIAIISAIWGAFRLVGRIQAYQKERDRQNAAENKRTKTSGSKVKGQPKHAAVELQACPRCGTYVPGGQHKC